VTVADVLMTIPGHNVSVCANRRAGLWTAIDLRPFYAMSPDLAIALPSGVARATVTLTYPESYKLR